MAVCPKCCTNLYQEREKVPSLENASTTPMLVPLLIYSTLIAPSAICEPYKQRKAII